jgi:hypothetical protein
MSASDNQKYWSVYISDENLSVAPHYSMIITKFFTAGKALYDLISC